MVILEGGKRFGRGTEMFLYGQRIVSHWLAITVRTEWRVERHPTPKRRRRWRVTPHRFEEPCCIKTPDAIYMHPKLYAQLRQELGMGRLPGEQT